MISKTHKGVRDWTVRAKRTGDITVTVKIGRMLHSTVHLVASTWSNNLYDQRQLATKSLAEAIGIPVEDWTSSELDRIPDEITRAINEIMKEVTHV